MGRTPVCPADCSGRGDATNSLLAQPTADRNRPQVRRCLCRRPEGQLSTHQPFIEKPDPAGIASRRLCTHESLDVCGDERGEEPLKHGQVQAFIFQRESQVSFKVWRRSVPGCQNTPSGFLPYTMVLTERRQGKGQWHAQAKGVDQRRIAGRCRPLGQSPLVKNGYGS